MSVAGTDLLVKFSAVVLHKDQMSQVMSKPVMSYTNNEGADQTAHPRSLISAFVVRCLDSIIIPTRLKSKL